MRTYAGLCAAVVLGCALTTPVFAQSAGPQIPNPTNPYPANPVATDGSSLRPGALGAGRRVTAERRQVDQGFFALTPRGY